MKEIFRSLVATFALVLLLPVSIFAQDACKPDSLFPPLVICGRSSSSACEKFQEVCQLKHVPILMGNIIEFVIVLLLIIVPIYIMYIGIQMILQHGIPKQLLELKNKLIWSIVYLVIIFSSWLIIKQVVDIFGISSDVPSFLLDANGNPIQNPGPSIK